MNKKHSPNSQSSRASLAIASALAGVQPVLPLYVGPGNCRDVVGHPWRWTRETAKRLGVAVITPQGSSKSLIPAQALIEALDREGLVREPEVPHVPEPGSAEELEQMRASLGLRLVGGGR